MTLALGWVALGIAIAIGAFRMDRLEHLHVEPWSAPGLVPGVLGVLITLFGAVLAWRDATSRRDVGAGEATAAGVPVPVGRIVAVMTLCGVFVFGLLGRGLPFVATSALLVFAWIALLRAPAWRATGSVPRGLGVAATIALSACVVIALLFQEVFLVRLP